MLTDVIFNRFFGIRLKSRIDGGIDLQAIAIEVIIGTIRFGVCSAPFAKLVSQVLSEIRSKTLIVVSGFEVQFNWNL